MADLVFERVTVDRLAIILRTRLPNAYPGGSNRSDLKKFKTYVRGKPEAQDFTRCAWVRTTNARALEDHLLKICSEYGCIYNVHSKSNVRAAPGFAYVLYN